MKPNLPSMRDRSTRSRSGSPRRLVIAALALTACAVTLRADLLPPVQDTSSAKANLTAGGGKASTLAVSATSKAFVLFNLESLPVGVRPADIANARLRVYFPKVTMAGDISITTATQAWTETAAGAEPTVAGAPIATFPSAMVVTKKFIEVDVTATVRAWRTTPATNFGFAFTAAGTTKVTLGAKEGAGTGYPAELEVQIDRATVNGSIGTAQLGSNLILGGTTIGTFSGSLAGNAASATTATTAGSATTATTAGNVTGIVAIANGGTGSATKSFVDLSTAQDIGGTKNFTGNVGIGTNNPGSLLSLSSPAINGSGISLTSGAFRSEITQKNFDDGFLTDHALQFYSVDTTGTDRAFVFVNSDISSALTILANGNVGIGTDTPLDKLTVIGGIAARDTVSTHGFVALSSGGGSTTGFVSWFKSGATPSRIGYMGFTDSAGNQNNLGMTLEGGANFSIAGGNVGIGTPTPFNKLDVANGGIIGNNSGGTSSSVDNSARGVKVGFGFQSTADDFLGVKSVIVPSLLNSTVNNGDLEFFTWANNIDNSREVMRINGAGNVGIGTPTPAFKLDVNGGIRCIGAVNTSSDARYKADIRPVAGALETIGALHGVSYEWNRAGFPEKDFPHRRSLGFIAQEVEKVLPEVVTRDADGYYSVAYSEVIPVLVEATKELRAENATLRQKLAALEARDAAREARLSRLEESLDPRAPRTVRASLDLK